MAEFSPECQAAREAFQRAMQTYYAARDAYLRARSETDRALAELNQAQQRLDDAQAALTQAQANWDAHVNAVRGAPDLGIGGVEAGVQPPQAPPGGAAVAGLFPTRVPPDFQIWAVGNPGAVSAWHVAADAAMQRANSLKAAAEQAEPGVARATRDLAVAIDAEAAAREAEAAAGRAKTAATEAATAAGAELENACRGETSSRPFGDGGGELEVGPLVFPEDEREVADRLDNLPDEETEGLNKVELRGEIGPVQEGRLVAAHYVVETQTVQMFITGHSEEVLKHEIGHHVYYHRFSDAARERWDRFYAEGTNAQQVPAGKMPTGYAATLSREGFAEVYEHYRDGKPLDPDVQRLIEELLAGLD